MGSCVAQGAQLSVLCDDQEGWKGDSRGRGYMYTYIHTGGMCILIYIQGVCVYLYTYRGYVYTYT